MRTDKRTAETPWQAIDVMTDETVGWYDDNNRAYLDNPDKALSVWYRPSRKKVTK
jgi:hypothetical protein